MARLPELTSQRTSDLLPLLALFFMALLFRIIRLFDIDVIFDEAVLLLMAKHSFVEILELCRSDNFPPLYPWLVKLWTSISLDYRWFRLLAALMGSLTAPAAYLLGREILNRKMGWLMGLACAVSVYLVIYSQVVRMFNIQPFIVCMSMLWFLKALKSNHWKHWTLMALANLIGFYVFIFMVFIVTAQFLILMISFRFRFKSYIGPLFAHVPFILGVLLWLVPSLHRYQAVQQAFWTSPFTYVEFFRFWIYLGTASNFQDRYWLLGIFNLMFYVGFVSALINFRKNPIVLNLGLVLVVVVSIIGVLSAIGQSFFHIRYLLYILPLWLAICLLGWLSLPRILWRTIGVALIFVAMSFSLLFYYYDYYAVHEPVGLIRPFPYVEKGEGHFFSDVAEEVGKSIKKNEAIIHYSDPYLRICSFFPSKYYHRWSLNEHIYSKSQIAQNNGRQYLEAGDQIRSLYDLKPLPDGIWLITLNPKVAEITTEVNGEGWMLPWMAEDNLLEELKEASYIPVGRFQRGKVFAIYYRREVATQPE